MNRKWHFGSALLLSIAGLGLAAAAWGQKRPLAPDDIYRLKAVADPQLSPDGSLVAYTVTTTEKAKNRRVSNIWMAPVNGGEPKALIGDVAARAPRWSPDGKWLAFEAGASSSGAGEAHAPGAASGSGKTPAGAKAQVWIVAPDGSGRRMITHLPGGAAAYGWSPDGTQLAVISKAPVKEQDFKDYTSMIYKVDGGGYYDSARSHIYIVDVKDGAARQLTRGDDRNDGNPEWSPDGKWIAYTSSNLGAGIRENVGAESLYIVPVAGGSPRTICREHAYLVSPRWSPDSTHMVYGAAPTPDDQQLLWTAPIADPSKAALASDSELFPTEIEWEKDGIWFIADDHGTAPVFHLAPGSRHPVKVLKGEVGYHSFQVGETAHRLVYLKNDSTHPTEIFASDENGGDERQLTFTNRELLSTLELSPAEAMEWKSEDGLMIQGFLCKPVGWQPGKKYPMILAIHGGPNGMFGFHFGFDTQLYAGHGYAVLMTNPRGSSGYGLKFQRAVAGEWGGKAYQDIISGVEAALARNSWIDRERLGVVGVSYGGFMTDWVVTQTHMFKAAIPISGISDLISVDGSRDGAYGHSRDFGGDLWENFDLYWKYSAVRLAKNVTTPVLFLHGEADNRVPSSQAEEYFRAIKHFGGTAELVLFPRESHGLSVSGEPKHLLETYQWRLYWFDRWVKGEANAAKPTGTGEGE